MILPVWRMGRMAAGDKRRESATFLFHNLPLYFPQLVPVIIERGMAQDLNREIPIPSSFENTPPGDSEEVKNKRIHLFTFSLLQSSLLWENSEKRKYNTESDPHSSTAPWRGCNTAPD